MSELIRMSNDIAKFYESYPADEGSCLIAEHINKFWPPSMRSKFFDILDTQQESFHPLVIQSAPLIRCEKRNPISLANMDRTGTGG